MGRAIGILRLRLRQLPDYLVNVHANANRYTDSRLKHHAQQKLGTAEFLPPSTQIGPRSAEQRLD